MPILAFVAEPPSQGHPVSQRVEQNSQGTTDFESKDRSEKQDVASESVGKAMDSYIRASTSEKIPIVRLDVDYVTDVMAAKLAASMLGHVLFLKSQIPLPVVQLSKMQGSKSSPRAAKLRSELLSSYDTLSSHLNTTFTALSTAFAKSKGNSTLCALESEPPVSQAFLAILVGPSLTSAKSKVVFAVDGLETKVWGAREDGGSKAQTHQGENPDEEEETDEEDHYDEEDAASDDQDEDDEDAEEPEESDDEGSQDGSDEGEESGSEVCTSEEATSPPLSRSPSPGPPAVSYAEEQKQLQTADRLFSRTLALADAEGNGMSADMTPTQTHVVLRAPRRFSHPAWVPRQNVAASLEATLDDFLVETGLRQDESRNQTKKKKGQAVEGAWVTPRNGLRTSPAPSAGSPEDEWDEMIWWSWDGKIVGFSEW